MPRRLVPAPLVIAALAASTLLLACEGDDNAGGTGPNLSTDQGLATAMVGDVVVPLIEKLNLAPYLSYLTPQGASLGMAECQPIEGCTSGSAEICPGVQGFQITFSDCKAGNTTVDGLLSVSGSAAEGTGSVALGFDNVALNGTFSYQTYENCLGVNFPAAALTLPNLNATLSGYIAFCDPPVLVGGRPVPRLGQITINIPERGRILEITLHEDPAGEYTILMLNLERTQTLLVCNGILYGEIVCSTE